MKKENVKNIVNKIYPKIKKFYGLSKWNNFPKVEIHRNIYERISGIEGMEGEENAQAEHCRFSNTIYIYYSEINSIKHTKNASNKFSLINLLYRDSIFYTS